MATELSKEQARRIRLRAQALAGEGETGATIAGVVHDCGGLQAQDARQAPLSIRARSRESTAADVDRAWFEDRTVARTWCMRGTRHFVATDDLSWLISLFGQLYVDRGQRRLAQLGFDRDDAERATETIREVLADYGPLTRDEVADHLLEERFEFDPDGQAPFHVIRRACLQGIAIEATPREGAETYALLEDWVSLNPAPNREDALADLARRYVTASEPATPEDLYSWSGLYKRDVQTGWEAIEDDLTEVGVEDEQAWTISDSTAVDADGSTTVRLLPMYDSYFLGHQDRDLLLPAGHVDRVYPGGGVVRATVVVDGLAAGTWRLDRSGPGAEITIEPFEPLDGAVEAEVEAEIQDVGRFLDRDVTYRIGTG